MGGSAKTSKTKKGSGKKKESRKEKALRFQRMGSELGLRDKRLKVEKLMKSKSKLVPKVVQFLESISEWPESDLSLSIDEGSSDDEVHHHEEAPCAAESARAASKKSGRPDSSTALLHKNYTSLEKLLVKHLVNLLTAMEPEALSLIKLKPVVHRGQ
eukprot:6484905-Amphidinium_carterae.1